MSERHTVSVHSTPDEVARLDEVRLPDVSRSAFMRGLLRSAGPLDEAPTHEESVRLLAESARRTDGELDEAIALTRSALELCAQQGDRHREAALLNTLADVLQDAGRAEDAMRELKRAVVIFAEVGATEEPQPEIWKLVEW
jgi:hypothetical protein